MQIWSRWSRETRHVGVWRQRLQYLVTSTNKRKGVGEPVAWSDNSRCSGELYVEELKLKGVFERCRSLSSFDAPEDLLHEAVKMWW